MSLVLGTLETQPPAYHGPPLKNEHLSTCNIIHYIRVNRQLGRNSSLVTKLAPILIYSLKKYLCIVVMMACLDLN